MFDEDLLYFNDPDSVCDLISLLKVHVSDLKSEICVVEAYIEFLSDHLEPMEGFYGEE